MRIPEPGRRVRWFVRGLAWFLVHCCGTVTLAAVERAIIEEVTSRAHHASTTGRPSPAQTPIRSWWTRYRTKRAVASLHRRLDLWKEDYRRSH